MITFAPNARVAYIVPLLVVIAVGLIALDGAARPASAQCPGQWIPGQQSLGTIRAFVTMPNGDLYAGGTSGVYRWNGTSWDALPGIANVNALANFNGEVVAGVTSNGVSRWTGSAWTPVGSNLGTVYALTVFNSELIAGGYFFPTLPYGQNVARWDGITWHVLGDTMYPSVRALAVYNGFLIAGGYLETSPGTGAGANGVGIWDGTAWHSLGGGLGGSSSPVRALTNCNGALIAGGEMSPRLASWNGSSWQNPSYPWGHVWSLTVFQGDLIAGSGCNCPTAAPFIWRLHNGTWQPIETLAQGAPASIPALAGHGSDLFFGLNFSPGWGIWRATCPRGDLNADGLVNAADQTILIDVLLKVDDEPDHIARADMNDDDTADGLDIAIFTACRTGWCP